MNSFVNERQAKLEYIALRTALNRANKLKNEESELEFMIQNVDDDPHLIIKSSKALSGLATCYYIEKPDRWMAARSGLYMQFFIMVSFEISTITKTKEFKTSIHIFQNNTILLADLAIRQKLWWVV